MKSAQTVVIERDVWAEALLVTEPFEAGWAGEAIWFIHVLETDGSPWMAVAEISPDGTNWVPLPQIPALPFEDIGVHALPIRHFGVWLRLSVTTLSPEARCKLRIMLTLK